MGFPLKIKLKIFGLVIICKRKPSDILNEYKEENINKGTFTYIIILSEKDEWKDVYYSKGYLVSYL